MPLIDADIPALNLRWANGNPEAADFLTNWARICRVADDIADGDSQDFVADMSELLIRTLTVNAGNRFFQANASALSAVMVNAILLWRKAEEWRDSDNRKTRMFGFVGREACEHVLFTVANITGGPSHALAVIEQHHQLSHQTSDETLEDWEAE